jgi:hypothetical protein
MVIELRCVILDFIALIFETDAFQVDELELLEINMSDVERVGSTTKHAVSSSY